MIDQLASALVANLEMFVLRFAQPWMLMIALGLVWAVVTLAPAFKRD